MRPVLVISLYMIGVVCAFGTVVSILGAELGDVVVFGAVAYACWLGIAKLTSNPYA